MITCFIIKIFFFINNVNNHWWYVMNLLAAVVEILVRMSGLICQQFKNKQEATVKAAVFCMYLSKGFKSCNE